MFRNFVRFFLPAFFTVCLVFSVIWTAYDVKDNFKVTMPTVTYEWIDGEYVVVKNPQGQQSRPLTAFMNFLDTVGQSGTSLISFIVDRGTYVLTAYSAENIPVPDYYDVNGLGDIGAFFQNVGLFFMWLGEYVKATINLLLFIVTLPIMIITWLLTAMFNILGFLLTGTSFADINGMVDWISTHPIGI